MKILPTSVALVAIAAVLIAGYPAGAQDSPESLLPPGFGDAPADPAPAPAPAPAPRPTGAPAPVPAPTGLPTPGASPSPGASPTPGATPSPVDPAELARYELPDYARRSTNLVGIVARGGALPAADAFGSADGRFLQGVMRRTDAPLASRWLSIALRRLLVAPVTTPAELNGADFAAERAWLLVRMGEAKLARAVVQAVDIENYTPKLFQVAMQAQLAAADPAGLCPLVERAQPILRERAWILTRAMCAGLAGEPNRAAELIDTARRQNVASGIDYLLAEKVVGSGAQGRREVTIEWDGVDGLTAWRFGLASATGEALPAGPLAAANPQVRHWYALAPSTALAARIDAAEGAAAAGVLSNAALVDLYSQVDDSGEGGPSVAAIARDLRIAYVAPTVAERVQILSELWSEPTDATTRHARQILTARAASMVPPAAEQAEAADGLIASMLTAGLDRSAARWRPIVAPGSLGWALIALSDPAQGASYAAGDASGFASDNPHRARMFVAGLAGLGRMDDAAAESAARSVGVAIGAENSWTRAISRAAQAGQVGTVVLLSALAMQTADWRGVSPEALFHIVAALRTVGLEGEARMIAAEAVARS